MQTVTTWIKANLPLVAIVLCVIAIAVLPSCNLKTTSPFSGKQVTGPELVLESRDAQAKLDKDRAQLAASKNARLAKIQNDAATALAEVSSEFDPQLGAIDAQVPLLQAKLDAAVADLKDKQERAGSLLAGIPQALASFGLNIPAVGIITSLLSVGFGITKAGQTAQAKQQLASVQSQHQDLIDSTARVIDSIDAAKSQPIQLPPISPGSAPPVFTFGDAFGQVAGAIREWQGGKASDLVTKLQV